MTKKDSIFLFISKNLYKLLLLISSLLGGVFISCLAITSWDQVNKIIFYLAIFTIITAIALTIKEWYDEHNKKYYDIPYQNLCIRLFDTYFRNWNDDPNNASKFRVSILLVKEDKEKKKKYAECHARYQTGERKKSEIRFYEGEGAAGTVIATGLPSAFPEPLPDFEQDPERYISECERIYNLNREKVLKLNVKARAYWCVPIRRFSVERELIAVVSIDSMLPNAFNSETFKKILAPKIISEINSFSSGIVI